MNSNKQTIDSAPSPYSLDSLSTSNRTLLINIFRNVTNASITENEVYDTKDFWDGRVFQKYVDHMRSEEHKVFLQLLHKRGVNYEGTFKKMNSGGLGKDKAQRVFTLSAEVQEKPLTLFLKEYIQYCRKNKFEPKGFIGHEETIEKLLKIKEPAIQKFLKENESPKPSPQDIVTINNEIEKIRCDLKFYPYGKNLLFHNNSKHQYTTALSIVDKLLMVSGNNVDLLSLKAILLCPLKRKREALKISRELLKQDSTHSGVLRTHAAVLEGLKKYEESLDVTRKAQKLHPNCEILSFNIGVCLEHLEKYENAIEEYKHMRFLDKDFVKPYYRLSACYHRLKQFKQSEAALKAALRIAPDNYRILMPLAINLSYQGKTDEAFQYMHSMLKAKDIGITSTYISAMIELKEDNIIEAETILNNLLDEPEFDLFEAEDQKSTAYSLLAGVLEEAFEKNPKNSKLLNYAKECHEIALKLYPKNRLSLESFAEISFLAGEYENAKHYLDQLSESIDSSPGYERFGWEPYKRLSHVAKEKNIDYILPLKWCVEKYEYCIECYVELAHECISSEDRKDAKVHIERVLEIYDSTVEDIDISLRNARNCYLLGKLLISFEEVWPQPGSYRKKAKELFEKCSTDIIKNKDVSLWLRAMYANAEAFRVRGEIDKNTDALSEAISIYKTLLKEYPSYKHREKWIDLNHKIALTFDLIWRIDNNVVNLETSIEFKKNLLQEITIEDYREDWCVIMSSIADSLTNIGKKYSKEESLEEAICLYRSVLNILNQYTDSTYWADINYSLGNAFMDLDEVNPDLKLLKDAKQYYYEVTKIADNSLQADAWTGVGNCCLSIGKRAHDADELEESINAFKYSLKILNKEQSREMWAYNQSQMGSAFLNLGVENSDCQAFLDSVKAFNSALEFYQDGEHIMDCFYCFHSRGLGLIELYVRRYDPNPVQLSDAVNSFISAMDLISIEKHPWDFANTYWSLGHALYLTGKLNGNAESFESAIHAYQQSQRINTIKDQPEKWAELQEKIDDIKLKLKYYASSGKTEKT